MLNPSYLNILSIPMYLKLSYTPMQLGNYHYCMSVTPLPIGGKLILNVKRSHTRNFLSRIALVTVSGIGQKTLETSYMQVTNTMLPQGTINECYVKH